MSLVRQIRKILILDEKSSSSKSREILLKSGVVGTVDDFDLARQAIRYIEQREFVFPEQLPDLALLEINLPENEGWQFLHSYSKLNEELKEKIHLVVLTSAKDEKSLSEAKNHPDVEEVLTKPITKEKVRDLQLKIWVGLKKEG
jgi:response regulator RpfG family c-di-GMP phosphodiesterase